MLKNSILSLVAMAFFGAGQIAVAEDYESKPKTEKGNEAAQEELVDGKVAAAKKGAGNTTKNADAKKASKK